MNKGFIVLVLMTLSCFSTVSVVCADTISQEMWLSTIEDEFLLPIKLLKFGGVELETAQKPILMDKKLLLPIRLIGEKLSWNIKWDAHDNSIVISNDVTHYRQIMMIY